MLYSDLQASKNSNSDGFRGLGYLDSHKDTVTIIFELKAPASSRDPSHKTTSLARDVRKYKKSHRSKIMEDQGKTVEIILAQDKTALRSRKGDTGSVLWRARFGSSKN